MNSELRRKLIGGFPNIFPVRDPLYPKGFDIPFQIDTDDGWFNLLYELCEKIQRELEKDEVLREHFEATQVKEKFAGLRFYISGGTREILDFIHEAEEKSYKICEKCGEFGIVRIKGGWYKTLCQTCAGDEWHVAKW